MNWSSEPKILRSPTKCRANSGHSVEKGNKKEWPFSNIRYRKKKRHVPTKLQEKITKMGVSCRCFRNNSTKIRSSIRNIKLSNPHDTKCRIWYPEIQLSFQVECLTKLFGYVCLCEKNTKRLENNVLTWQLRRTETKIFCSAKHRKPAATASTKMLWVWMG